MTRDEYFEKINKICEVCAAGNPARYRPETGEWVHDRKRKIGNGHTFSHFLCYAHYFRKEHPEISEAALGES